MYELPLFPLNTVLFPNMPLRLHIFEDRYKQMMNECIEQQQPFGVVLIEEGEEALGPVAQPHLVGTTAQIIQVQRLQFGRMNILAIGRERFRVAALNHDKPYLSGMVNNIAFTDEAAPSTLRRARLLHPLLNRYLTSLETTGQVQFDPAQIPTDALPLAYLSAVVLQTEVDAKQALLEAATAYQLIDTLVSLYQRELAFLRIMLNPPTANEHDGVFSDN